MFENIGQFSGSMKPAYGFAVLLFCCSDITSIFTQVFLGYSFRWRHNGRDGVSNHQPDDCLLNRLFRHRSKKRSKLRVTSLCGGPMNRPHKWPVTQKMFPFDDVIMFTGTSAVFDCTMKDFGKLTITPWMWRHISVMASQIITMVNVCQT